MPRPSNKHRKYVRSIAHARAGRRYVPDTVPIHEASLAELDNTATNPIILDLEPEDDDEICTWAGGVNNHLEDDLEGWIDLSEDSDDDDEIEELEGDELRESLESQMAREAETILEAAVYQKLMRKITPKEWKKAELNRGLGYNGQSERSQQRRKKNAREKEFRDKQSRKSSVHVLLISRCHSH